MQILGTIGVSANSSLKIEIKYPDQDLR